MSAQTDQCKKAYTKVITFVQMVPYFSAYTTIQKFGVTYKCPCFLKKSTAQTGPNQNRKRSGRSRCRTEQEDKYITLSSLRNRCLTNPQLAASLNSTCKTPVSPSTVTRRLRDAGLLGRVAKKKPYLRLANKNKRLTWAKEHRH